VTERTDKLDLTIWWFAFGYFAAYAPYSALTKYLSKTQGIGGVELLPPTGAASLVAMFICISAIGWWKYAGRRTFFGVEVPFPNKWTFLSGLCTATIIPTTTLAYTFGGISIVFMMLLMRGGVLIIAPIVDFFSKRRVRWFSWVALGLSVGALLAAFFGDNGSVKMTFVAGLDLFFYLLAYFIRLRFMSRLAKSDDENARTRYFVEEQMVATPVLMLVLGLVALSAATGLTSSPEATATLRGFTAFFTQNGSGVIATAIVIGVLSQGTGIFGGLILLDKRENTYCVPVNRASSILAGVVASLLLWLFVDYRFPRANELIGAGLIISAIAVLSIPPLLERRRQKQASVTALPTTQPVASEAPREKHG